MSQKTGNILSIGINRQRVGIAVFVSGELEYVTGRALPGEASRSGRRELLADLDDLIRNHNVRVVAMPQLPVQQRHSPAVLRVYKRIQASAIRSGLILVVSGSRIRERSGTNTEETLACLYPELRRYLGDAAWQRRYYKHIFKAVSAAIGWLRMNERGEETK